MLYVTHASGRGGAACRFDGADRSGPGGRLRPVGGDRRPRAICRWRRGTTPARCCIAAWRSMMRRANSPGWRVAAHVLGAAAGCAAGRPSAGAHSAREVILAGKPPEAISLHNIVPGTVRRIAADAARRAVMVEIALPGGALSARVTPDAVVRLGCPRASGAGADQVHLDRGTGKLGMMGCGHTLYPVGYGDAVHRVSVTKAFQR